MMKYEFEEIAGYEVSQGDYDNIIEPMYMATNLSKAEFVKIINKKRFALRPIASIIKEMKKLAAQLEETCVHFTDYETKDKLDKLVKEYMNRRGYVGSFAHSIHEEMKFTCYYPTEVTIFSTRSYKTMETISLV